MNKDRFIQAASILFGVFTLFCVLKAFDNMLGFLHAQVSGNSIRFTGIFVASVFGLAFLVPQTTIPALRKTAQATDPNFIRCICFFALFVSVFISGLAGLTGYVPVTVFVITIFVFFSSFVCPGYALFGLDISSPPVRSIREFEPLVTDRLKHGPLAERLSFCAIGILLCAGLVAFIFFGHAVASETWHKQINIPSFILAGAIVFFVARPWIQVVPNKVLARSVSKILPMSVVLLVLSVISSKALLQNGVVAVAAMTLGTETTLSGKIVRLAPWERRRDCSGAVYVWISGRQHEFCDLSDVFFENSKIGDTYIVTGLGTRLGVLPEKYFLSNSQREP